MDFIELLKRDIKTAPDSRRFRFTLKSGICITLAKISPEINADYFTLIQGSYEPATSENYILEPARYLLSEVAGYSIVI